MPQKTFLSDEISQKFFHIRDQHSQFSRNQCIYVKYYYFKNFNFGAL